MLVSTLDAANKMFANLLVGPAKALRNLCQISLAVLDEGQRFETLPAAAIVSHTQTAVIIADANQRIEPDKTFTNRNPWATDAQWGTIRNPEVQWATDLVLDPAASVARCLNLTLCKRCGPVVTNFCRHVFPFLENFRSHEVAPQTELQFNFYSGSRWWPASGMPGPPTDATHDVAWHEWLFRCLAATIVVQLNALECQLTTWDSTAMVVLVVCYLNRLVRPLATYLSEVVAGAKEKGLLGHAVAANVQVCIVDTLTGPTSEISHIIRHRRMTKAEDQHKGNQADLHRLYVGLTRARRSTTVWLEKEPFGVPWDRAPAVRRSVQASDAGAQAFFNKMFDAIDEQRIPWEDMGLGNWADPLPRVAHYGGEPGDSWAWGLSEVLKKASSAWERVAPIPSLPTTWKNLDAFLVDAASGKCEFVTLPLADVRQQPGGIEAAWNAPLQFAKARPDISSLHEAFQKNHFEDALNLGRKLVNGIVCTQVGHTNLQLSLPTVNAAGLAEFYCGAAVDGEPMIRSFVTFVWALYNATFQDEEESGPRLLQAVFAHKTEETHYGELHWWSRCCNSDREASILVAPDLAAKKKRQCYAYLGGGQLSSGSTTLLENIVVKVKSWEVGACAVAAAALLSRAAEDGHRVEPRADLWLAADDAAETEDKLAVMLGEAEEADGGVAGAADVAGAGAAAGSARGPKF